MKFRATALLLAFLLAFCGCGTATPVQPDVSAAPSSSLPPASTPAAGPPTTITLLAAGDNLIHDVIYQQAARRKPGSYDFTPAYAGVSSLIQSADIAVINQETPLASAVAPVSNYPLFCSPVELGEQLLDLGFDVFTQANNHSYDQRAVGIRAVMAFWDAHPKGLAVGMYRDANQRDTIRYTTVKGITVAFLAAADQTNGITLPSDATEGVMLLSDTALLQRQLAEARENADFVVFSAHWGVEGTDRVSEEQRNMARQLVDWGADLILGTHPHVLQPCQEIPRSDGSRGLVIYSLGNFISAQQTRGSMAGGLLQVSIAKTPGQRAVVSDYTMIPTITHYEQGYAQVRVVPLADYTPQLAAAHGVSRYQSGFTMGYLADLYQKLYPGRVELPGWATANPDTTATTPQATAPLSAAPAKQTPNAAIDEICKEYRVTGMSVAAFAKNTVVYTHSYGYANQEAKRPATADTVYRTASVAKAVTAMLALRLCDQGVLDLDHDISDYTGVPVRNPSYPSDPLTLRQLMTHSSSIADTGAYTAALEQRSFPSLSKLMRYNIFSPNKPGSTYLYSNLSGGMVGGVAAGAAGKPLWQLAEEQLFAPLGLSATYLSKALPNQQDIACIYSNGQKTFDPARDGTTAAYYKTIPSGELFLLGQGDLYLTAAELAKLGMVLAGNGQVDGVRVLAEPTVRAINSLQFHVDAQTGGTPEISRGLGVQLFPELLPGQLFAGHQGNAYGMIACLLYQPDKGTGVAFLTNGCYTGKKDGVVYDINREIVDVVYQLVLPQE